MAAERRPLGSLGSDSQFLDHILGEMLHPLEAKDARARAWGRRSGQPSAPPMEYDFLTPSAPQMEPEDELATSISMLLPDSSGFSGNPHFNSQVPPKVAEEEIDKFLRLPDENSTIPRGGLLDPDQAREVAKMLGYLGDIPLTQLPTSEPKLTHEQQIQVMKALGILPASSKEIVAEDVEPEQPRGSAEPQCVLAGSLLDSEIQLDQALRDLMDSHQTPEQKNLFVEDIESESISEEVIPEQVLDGDLIPETPHVPPNEFSWDSQQLEEFGRLIGLNPVNSEQNEERTSNPESSQQSNVTPRTSSETSEENSPRTSTPTSNPSMNSDQILDLRRAFGLDQAHELVPSPSPLASLDNEQLRRVFGLSPMVTIEPSTHLTPEQRREVARVLCLNGESSPAEPPCAATSRLVHLASSLAEALPPVPPLPCQLTPSGSWIFSAAPTGGNGDSSSEQSFDTANADEQADRFESVVESPWQQASAGDRPAAGGGQWRASMRRVTPFRLDADVPPPRARPASAPVARGSAPAVPGRRRRLSTSTADRRREHPRSPDHSSWTDFPISDDEESPVASPDRSAQSTVPPTPVHSNISQYEMPRDCVSSLGQWPHGLSSVLASLGCTLGLFNISRFAILSVQFGANFVVQFVIMSALVGIPLFTFHVSMGQLLAAGTVDMWRISPIFQGVGIALLMSQALLGIYSIVGVSWMFIYFRDSFITKQDIYRWAEPFNAYRDDGQTPFWNSTQPARIEETVPDYWSGVVLQRSLSSTGGSPGNLKFQATFNLAVVWMLVFISLSKGLKSYGKVVYLFSLVPVFGMLLFCSKLLGFMPTDPRFQFLFPETEWSEFFLNSKSWVAASTEAFFTWGLLGAAAMQVASHNRPKHYLHRDTAIVIVFTLSILALSAFLANSCTQILLAHGFIYTPSSFEQMSSYSFLYSTKNPLPHAFAGTPVRWLPHSQFVVGESVQAAGSSTRQASGYQALRLATELVPATLALIGPSNLSPFWSVLFYFVLILFGIAQQLAIWHCLITGIMAINIKKLKHWETTITFFTCACGFVLGLPMATQFGIFVVYFLDVCVGGGWWLMVLYLIELLAVFMVRGRPYSGETVVAALFSRAGTCLQNMVAPMLSFVWNVILPVLMMVVCITLFKNGVFREFFRWSGPMFYDYWPSWTREFGCLLQLVPLLTIPFIGLIQSCRYLCAGPSDIFDRIQMLYRPDMGSVASVLDIGTQAEADNGATVTSIAVEDPPPKYTPPPSYTTATGARIAKLLRQSFRRSVRRITSALAAAGEASSPSPGRTRRAPLPLPPPPNYSDVLVEMHQSHSSDLPDSGTEQRSTLTADNVATILRSSLRRHLRAPTTPPTAVQSSSSERLVDAAAPINHDSIVLETIESDKSLDLHRH